MNDLFFARSQMGMSLAFHIIFAVLGMAMPLLMAVSEGFYLWTKRPIYLELSKRWAAGTAILFAVGAHWAILRRWAEPHYLASHGLMAAGTVLLYTPRDASELEVCRFHFSRAYACAKDNCRYPEFAEFGFE